MGEENILPGREKYKIQIINLINSKIKEKKEKQHEGN